MSCYTQYSPIGQQMTANQFYGSMSGNPISIPGWVVVLLHSNNVMVDVQDMSSFLFYQLPNSYQ